MCSSSSATSAVPPTIQQLIQKQINPTPQQQLAAELKKAESGSSGSSQDALNARGTGLNISA